MKYFLFPLLIFISGCLMGSEYERSNSIDPESSSFKAEFTDPEARMNLEDRAFQINWISQSSFEDGHLVEKKLKNKFIVLDTVVSQSFYMDSTGEYTAEMEYKVSSFRYDEKGNIKNKYSKKAKHISFGYARSFIAYQKNDSLAIQWFRNSFLDDITVLEFRRSNNQPWDELYKENQQNVTSRQVYFDLSLDHSYEFRIRLFMNNYKNELEEFFRDTTYYENK